MSDETNKASEGTRMKQIQETLHNELKEQNIHFFDIATRTLLREGLVSTMSKQTIHLRAFLFNDMLLFLQEGLKSSKGQQIYKKVRLVKCGHQDNLPLILCIYTVIPH